MRRRNRKPHRKPRTLTSVSWLLAGLTLALWLVGMTCATIGLAESISQISYDHNEQAVADAHDIAYIDEAFAYDDAPPGFVEDRVYQMLGYASVRNFHLHGYNSEPSVLRNVLHEVDIAAVVLLPDGSIFAESGAFLRFGYQTQETWDAVAAAGGSHDGFPDGYACVFFDPEKLVGYGKAMYERSDSYPDCEVIRLTGRLEGSRFYASRIDYIDREEFDAAKSLRSSFTYSGVVQEHDLQWHPLYEDPSNSSGDEITLYSVSLGAARFSFYEPTGPVTFNFVQYDSLLDLLHHYEKPSASNNYNRSAGLLNQVIIDERYIHERVETGGELPDYQERYTLIVATQFSPLLAAMRELRNVYIVTALLALALWYYARKIFRTHITHPVALLADGMKENYRYLGTLDDWPGTAELTVIYEQYDRTRTQLAMQRDELQRLKTALDYAQKAEQSRREMTSHIAHELKTPLAVLHTYAEGLTERIAEDKRDHYLAVIQGEVERMDELVLEMLDLSRLEAGRVSLLREDFPLSELTQEVWQRFEKQAADRDLRVHFEFTDPGTVNADRGRIEQVVTNYLSNAVRYCTEGGEVRIAVRSFRGKVTFTAENSAAPFSQEALSKVFDSFYRVDESRSSAGTGLGLAICKSILALHGGSCAVRNTDLGVEFRFTI